MTAIVHRKRGRAWEFEWDGSRFCTAKGGRVYVILVGGSEDVKPVWIGRKMGGYLVAAEADIRATHIEFPNGGVYVFPGQEAQ